MFSHYFDGRERYKLMEQILDNGFQEEHRLMVADILTYEESNDHSSYDDISLFEIVEGEKGTPFTATSAHKLNTLAGANATPIPDDLDPAKVFDAVALDKCLSLHQQMAKCMQNYCGECNKYLAQPRKCAQCNMFQYCNQKCQKRHWKRAHKPFCALLQLSEDEKLEQIRETVFGEGSAAVQDPPRSHHSVFDNQWDGIASKEMWFDRLRAYASDNGMASLIICNMMKNQPRNIAYQHGPETFLKCLNYALQEVLSASDSGRKTWVALIASWFDPFYPEQSDVPKTFMLHSNVRALESSPSTVKSMIEVYLTRGMNALLDWLAVFNNLSDFGFAANRGQWVEIPDENVEHPIHQSLPIDVHERMLGYLEDEDKLNLARTCKGLARMSFQFEYERLKEAWRIKETVEANFRQLEEKHSDFKNAVVARDWTDTTLFDRERMFMEGLGTAEFLESMEDYYLADQFFTSSNVRNLMIMQKKGMPFLCPMVIDLLVYKSSTAVAFKSRWSEFNQIFAPIYSEFDLESDEYDIIEDDYAREIDEFSDQDSSGEVYSNFDSESYEVETSDDEVETSDDEVETSEDEIS